MLWLDTTSDTLKIRDENNADWIAFELINSAANTLTPVARAIRATSGSGISIQNTAGSEVLKLVPATNQEAIDGLDSRKVITPRSLSAALGGGIPTSINTYTTSRTITLPSEFKAMYVQLSGGGGGGGGAAPLERAERGGPQLASFVLGSNGISSRITLPAVAGQFSAETILTATGGSSGSAGLAYNAPPNAGALGGQGVNHANVESGRQNGEYAKNGNNAPLVQGYFTSANYADRRMTITIGAGGRGGDLTDSRYPDFPRPIGQDGQRGFATIWIWT